VAIYERRNGLKIYQNKFNKEYLECAAEKGVSVENFIKQHLSAENSTTGGTSDD